MQSSLRPTLLTRFLTPSITSYFLHRFCWTDNASVSADGVLIRSVRCSSRWRQIRYTVATPLTITCVGALVHTELTQCRSDRDAFGHKYATEVPLAEAYQKSKLHLMSLNKGMQSDAKEAYRALQSLELCLTAGRESAIEPPISSKAGRTLRAALYSIERDYQKAKKQCSSSNPASTIVQQSATAKARAAHPTNLIRRRQRTLH